MSRHGRIDRSAIGTRTAAPDEQEASVGRRTLGQALVQRKAIGSPGERSEAVLAQAAGSGGVALPEGLAGRLSASLGSDLSGVRVHTGAASSAAAEAISARAYTVGQDIHFGAGEYSPGTPAGDQLIAHEVAHTVQQGSSAGAPQTKLEVSQPGDAHEQEADAFAAAFGRGESMAVSGGAAPALARWEKKYPIAEIEQLYFTGICRLAGTEPYQGRILQRDDSNDFGPTTRANMHLRDGFRGTATINYTIKYRLEVTGYNYQTVVPATMTWDIAVEDGIIRAFNYVPSFIKPYDDLVLTAAQIGTASASPGGDTSLGNAWSFGMTGSGATDTEGESAGVNVGEVVQGGASVSSEHTSGAKNQQGGGDGPSYLLNLHLIDYVAPKPEPKAPEIHETNVEVNVQTETNVEVSTPDHRKKVPELPDDLPFHPRDGATSAYTLKFEKEGQTKLSSGEEARLRSFCDFIRGYQGGELVTLLRKYYRIEVMGYASNTAGSTEDDKVSAGRAASVHAVMKAKGLMVADNLPAFDGHDTDQQEEERRGKVPVDKNPNRKAEIRIFREREFLD